MIDTLKKNLKSKTMVLNAVMAGLVPALKALGVELSPDQVGMVFMGLNWILRQFTKGPVKDKKLKGK